MNINRVHPELTQVPVEIEQTAEAIEFQDVEVDTREYGSFDTYTQNENLKILLFSTYKVKASILFCFIFLFYVQLSNCYDAFIGLKQVAPDAYHFMIATLCYYVWESLFYMVVGVRQQDSTFILFLITVVQMISTAFMIFGLRIIDDEAFHRYLNLIQNERLRLGLMLLFR